MQELGAAERAKRQAQLERDELQDEINNQTAKKYDVSEIASFFTARCGRNLLSLQPFRYFPIIALKPQKSGDVWRLVSLSWRKRWRRSSATLS